MVEQKNSNAEIWVNVGGDKGGNSLKMNFQMSPTLTPVCFPFLRQATLLINLHVALEAHIEALEGLQWRLVAIPSNVRSQWYCLSLNMPINPMYFMIYYVNILACGA